MNAPSTVGIRIRPAASRDLDTLAAWAAELLHQWDATATEGDARSVYERILRSPDLGIVLVAEQDGVPSGFVYAASVLRAEYAGETMELVEMFVAWPWRSKGVGRGLLDALVAHARERNVHRIACQVHPGNAAIERALESGGFDPERRTLWGILL
jgi:GNAT superfamily N-acetyltransferase